MAKNWFKNAILYSVDVETFLDTDRDGVGDFIGLSRSLDYLSGLGATCIWLHPFFPSPDKDNGYDIADYFNVDPKFGTFGHFVEFLDIAEERGIKVLVDLVVNHTSKEHPWFQEARKNKESKYRKYYIWVDEKPENDQEDVIFGHIQGGNWEYDEEAGQYYYHTFYRHQPDLNISNPEVQREIKYILHFWLKLGISGFRMDAVPHMIKEKGNEKFDGDPHQFLRDLREFVEEHRKDAILLAEVDTEPEKYRNFLGNGDQVHMLFNFYLNNYLFLAFAREEAEPIAKAIKALPQLSQREQLGTFLRNHDELDLERLTDEERNEVYKTFAPDENMRIYNRGIRRRLAPMLNNERKKMELAHSLLFSLPGTPVLRYGQEIGMGDDLSLKERNSVRTTMQWSKEKHGGFSLIDTEKIPVAIIKDGEYGYKKVNVHDQMRDPNSFLNWIERVISMRKECIEFGYGQYDIIKTNHPAVLAHCCKWKNGISLAAHNLSGKECEITLELEEKERIHLIECFGDRQYEVFDGKTGKIKLMPYGYRWFRKSSLFL